MDSAAWEDASPGRDAAIRPRMTTSAGRYALQVEMRLVVWLACEMLVAQAYPLRRAFVGCCGDEAIPASEGHGCGIGRACAPEEVAAAARVVQALHQQVF